MFSIELPSQIGQLVTRTSRPARLWGLALGADLAVLNGSKLNCLHTGYLTAVERESLKVWWRVGATEQLRYQLESLFASGHAGEFARVVSSVNGDGTMDTDSEQLTTRRVEFVRARWAECRRAGHIRAFDLGRVITLARAGYTARYISGREAWRWIARAAEATQPLFGSWGEFAASYRLGMEFWDAADPGCTEYFRHRTWLLADAASPWVRLPWGLPLSSQ